ncbi:hypothetical protein [Tenacibaculum aestuariivivum]|uniref:hypothetical protein n=1 Tax=Tenacibaculum aestuariivivum TaxID=2006131 RepID=UPI003AB69EF3
MSNANAPYIFRYTIRNSETGCNTSKFYRIRYRGANRTIIANGGNDIVGACGVNNFSFNIVTTGSGYNSVNIVSGPPEYLTTISPTATYPVSIEIDMITDGLDLPSEGVYTLEFIRSQGGGITYRLYRWV